MTTYYVNSTVGGGAGTGADRANAFTTLVAALAAATPTLIYVASVHSELLGSAMTLTSSTSSTAPIFIYCVDFAGRADPTAPTSADLRTTAVVGTSGAFDVTKSGFAVVDGVIFSAGSGAVAQSLRWSGAVVTGWKYRNCELKLGGTSGGNFVFGAGGATANVYELENTGFRFGNVASMILLNLGQMVWRNTASAIRGSVPTNLFGTSSASPGNAIIDGVDLSPMVVAKNIVNGSAAAAPTKLFFSDCKLDASVTRYAAVTATYGTEAFFVRCGSAGNFDFSKHSPLGNLTCETTAGVVRTGGASDGTAQLAYKIVTTANAKWTYPFECPPLAIWNDVITSTITLTVYGVWTGGALPNNDDIWMDIQYLGDASSPAATFATTTKADGLATGAAVDADGSTWGGGTTVFKLTKTITAPAQKGDILVHVKIGAASATVYIDPKVVQT